MAITDNLRQQHRELLGVVEQMSSQLIPVELSKDASYMYGLLLELSENLQYHLQREDKALYPALFRHPDEKISTLAKKYLDEMGGISDEFHAYMTRWPHAMAVQENPEKFIHETKGIFNALSSRIEKEDNELYPLLEFY